MHDPTPEQAAIIAAAVSSEANLLVNALAGAAKTSTLVMIAQALPPSTPILCLAFNKRIASEMTERMPGHVRCATLNAIGHRTWGTAIGKRLTVDTKKNFTLLSELVDEMLPRGTDFDFGDMLQLVRQAKSQGYLPAGAPAHAHRMFESKEEFYAGLEEDPTDWQDKLLDPLLMASIKKSYDGYIDFDDQVYMSSIFGGAFPAFPLVMIDEAQDLSRLNHRMLDKLFRKRLIAVGDPWQSIYAFRGAISSGMSQLKTKFSMDEYTLSVSFRCPEAIVRRAWSRVRHFRWRDGAPLGEVRTLRTWNAQTIENYSAVICRNNAPLFKLALELMKAGRGCQIIGADIGPGLIKVLKKLGDESMPQKEVLDAIDQWEKTKLLKARAPGSISDRAECLRVFAGFGTTLSETISYAEHLFQSKGPIQLLSGHKAKGLEWDSVYHLDPWRIPSKWAQGEEALEQELNVRYVIETRAKETLSLINLSQMEELQDDPRREDRLEIRDQRGDELEGDADRAGAERSYQDAIGYSSPLSRG